jgi:hypothetical protein
MLIALIPLIALNAASPLITLTCAWPSCKLQIYCCQGIQGEPIGLQCTLRPNICLG